MFPLRTKWRVRGLNRITSPLDARIHETLENGEDEASAAAIIAREEQRKIAPWLRGRSGRLSSTAQMLQENSADHTSLVVGKSVWIWARPWNVFGRWGEKQRAKKTLHGVCENDGALD